MFLNLIYTCKLQVNHQDFWSHSSDREECSKPNEKYLESKRHNMPRNLLMNELKLNYECGDKVQTRPHTQDPLLTPTPN